jgi:cytochrome c oxidase cbb3-type subunit 3
MTRAHRLSAVAIALGASLVACSKDRPAPPGLGGRPAVIRPVGPVPGAPESPPPPNPFADDRAALVEGRRLFVAYNCAGCHGDHGGGGMGPSLRDPDWIYGGHGADIFDSITEGRAHGMPAWGVRLPEQQIWKLAAYVQSLRTPAEPEPPQ